MALIQIALDVNLNLQLDIPLCGRIVVQVNEPVQLLLEAAQELITLAKVLKPQALRWATLVVHLPNDANDVHVEHPRVHRWFRDGNLQICAAHGTLSWDGVPTGHDEITFPTNHGNSNCTGIPTRRPAAIRLMWMAVGPFHFRLFDDLQACPGWA